MSGHDSRQSVEQARDRLQSLVAEIVVAEESLRQALAAELHSGLGQELALTRMRLSALRNSSSADLGDPLTGIEGQLENADRSLRSIADQLGPPVLHDLGLVPALQWLAEDLEARRGLVVQIQDEGALAQPDDRIRGILFRAVRESLIHTATHAGTRHTRVRLAARDGVLRITVEAEGAGFDIGEVDLGSERLHGIRAQLRHMGCDLRVESTPGRGATMVLTAPVTT